MRLSLLGVLLASDNAGEGQGVQLAVAPHEPAGEEVRASDGQDEGRRDGKGEGNHEDGHERPVMAPAAVARRQAHDLPLLGGPRPCACTPRVELNHF